MVNPFQIQSIEPEFSSISLESQLIGFFTSSHPRLSHTSCARSRSKPTYSPLSSLYPKGGYCASNPTVNVLLSASAYTETTPVIIEAAITPAMSTAKDLFFMINISSLSVLLFITQPLYHVKVCVNPITHLRLCQE